MEKKKNSNKIGLRRGLLKKFLLSRDLNEKICRPYNILRRLVSLTETTAAHISREHACKVLTFVRCLCVCVQVVSDAFVTVLSIRMRGHLLEINIFRYR